MSDETQAMETAPVEDVKSSKKPPAEFAQGGELYRKNCGRKNNTRPTARKSAPASRSFGR